MFEVMTGVIGILHKILYPSILEFYILYIPVFWNFRLFTEVKMYYLYYDSFTLTILVGGIRG